MVAPSNGPTLAIAESAPFPAAFPMSLVLLYSSTPLEIAVIPRSAKVNYVPNFPNNFAPFEKWFIPLPIKPVTSLPFVI